MCLTTSSLVEVYATNREISTEVGQQQSTTLQQDPFSAIRAASDVRALGAGLFALTACVIAVLVLLRWQEGKHARWSRAAAQAALGLGVLGLVFAILLYSGLISGIPDVSSSSSSSVSSNG